MSILKNKKEFDVIVIGGSYAGLSAALSLGRAFRKVMIIDAGDPCNKQTVYSHNFLTMDGKKPSEIIAHAKDQVLKYPTVTFMEDMVDEVFENEGGFIIKTKSEISILTKKIIFATGLTDLMPDIPGFGECWGISILHCPYCHGYEFKNQKTGLLDNGDAGFEFTKVLANWTKDITLFTNGKSKLNRDQTQLLLRHNISIIEGEIESFEHIGGNIQNVFLKDQSKYSLSALYTKPEFVQQSSLPEKLGCNFNDHGLIDVDIFQRTSIQGIYAAGDNSTVGRAVAVAVAAGSVAGIMLNKELTDEEFNGI